MLWLQWQAHVHGTLEFVGSGALLSTTRPWGGLRICSSSEPPRGSPDPVRHSLHRIRNVQGEPRDDEYKDDVTRELIVIGILNRKAR